MSAFSGAPYITATDPVTGHTWEGKVVAFFDDTRTYVVETPDGFRSEFREEWCHIKVPEDA